MELKVGLIGMGFVGNALYASFSRRGQHVVAYDKYKNIGEFEYIVDTEILFLCLPTPYVSGFGYNLSAIHETCQKLSDIRYPGLVVLKSTVEPGTTDSLAEKYSLNIVHNPEFLSQKTAEEDFDSQTHIVIGSNLEQLRLPSINGYFTAKLNIAELKSLYEKLYPQAVISVSTSVESETMKLFCNSFYAMKVQMFTEFFLLCQKTGADFDLVKKMMFQNGWINPMHTQVPGHDGQLSYSGACFPKDTNALNQFMKNQNSLHGVLDAVIEERNKLRKD